MRHYKHCYFCYLLILNVKTKENWELKCFMQFDLHVHVFSGCTTTCFYFKLSFSAIMFQSWKFCCLKVLNKTKKHHCSFASDISITDMARWHFRDFWKCCKNAYNSSGWLIFLAKKQVLLIFIWCTICSSYILATASIQP